jgi:hypothetical protein
MTSSLVKVAKGLAVSGLLISTMISSPSDVSALTPLSTPNLPVAQQPIAPLKAKLPKATVLKIQTDIAQRFKVPTKSITIAAAERRSWRTCLGFALRPGMKVKCPASSMSGWQVVAKSQNRSGVYHTDQTGVVVQLNSTANLPKSSQIPAPELMKDSDAIAVRHDFIVFQSAMTTGFAPGYYAIDLAANGEISRRQIAPKIGNPEVIKQVSPKQVKDFIKLVRETNKFASFHQLSYYQPDRIAADAASFQFTLPDDDKGATVMQYTYSDLEQLPINLQRVIRAWDTLVQE